MNNSPVILAVDTTSEFSSVAVRRAGQTVAEVQLHAPDGSGQFIIQAIEQALAQANIHLREIECFAAAHGPGSFTGVRVGLAVVKGLADTLHKPAAGISNLRALSLAGHAPLRAVALDARRQQIYGAVYDAASKLVVEETLATWSEWLKQVPPSAEFIGLDGGPCQIAGIPFTTGSKWLAAAIAACAEINGPTGWSDPVALDANYVRRSDAEMFWTDLKE
jgi:tRNA threonylcarbamoyladenosine biosynthesis protein TsaB